MRNKILLLVILLFVVFSVQAQEGSIQIQRRGANPKDVKTGWVGISDEVIEWLGFDHHSTGKGTAIISPQDETCTRENLIRALKMAKDITDEYVPDENGYVMLSMSDGCRCCYIYDLQKCSEWIEKCRKQEKQRKTQWMKKVLADCEKEK